MKKTIYLVLVAVFVFAFAASALAAAPTVIDTDGGSRWSYQDGSDATAKREGGYLPFNAGTIYASAGASYTSGVAGVLSGWFYNQALFATKGPHGGYDTSTNKCKACHAVHRAEGTYYLLRADTQDDACNYCHIGASAKSADVVYSGNPLGIYTPNGHTMGAGSRIPGSTTTMTVTSLTVGGTPITVRNYVDEKKQLYRTTGYGRSPAGHPTYGSMTSVTWGRVGPTSLNCSSCHQVHNAQTQIWQPPQHGTDRGSTGVKLTQGYKLLRRFPGATVFNDAGRINPATVGPFGTTVMAKVPESTLSVGVNYSTSRSGLTTYTDSGDGGTWRQPDWVLTTDMALTSTGNPALVSEYAMSVWCADCHNLNIGAPGAVVGSTELGQQKMHADRTHPVPASRALQCYSCHRSGLGSGGTSCERCHYGPPRYRTDAAATTDFLGRPTDFPHAGANDEYKLLGAFSLSTLPPATIASYEWTLAYKQTTITPNNLDAVCIRCHTEQGIQQ